MGIAWIATFDEGLDASVLRIWAALEAEGLGSTPGQLGERPHVSLFLGDGKDESAALGIFEDSLAPRMGATLQPAGIFLGPAPVLYLALAPTEDLLGYHRGIHARIEAAGLARDPHYLPDSCVFHCTLAVGLRREDLPRALAVVDGYSRPLAGRIEGMQLLRYFPVEVLGQK